MVEAPARGASTVSASCLLAVLLVLTDAHLVLLQEAFLEERGVVLLRDPLDRKGLGGLLLLAVHAERVRLRLLPVDERDRGSSCSVRLERDVLEDRSGLPAGEDVLQTRRGRILTG